MPPSATRDLPTEPLLRLEPGMHGAPIRRIEVDAAGRYLVTGSHDKTVRVWSLADGQLLRTLRVPLGEGDVGKVHAVAITPDGDRIAAGGWGPNEGAPVSIYIFERASGRIVARVDGLPNAINHLAFSPDARHLVACLGGSNGIRIYETGALQEIASDRDYGDGSYWAAFDRAGRLATSSFDGKIRLFDPGFRLSQSKEAPGGKRPYGVAFSPDGRQIAVGYNDSMRVDVLDGQALGPLFAADTSGKTSGNRSKVAWSVDGRNLYAAGGAEISGKRFVRAWADGGRGAYEDIPLSQDTIMDLRPLADGRLAFGAQDPSLGILGADGKIVWRQDPAQADFRDQTAVFAASENGQRVRFGFWLDPDGEFDIAARRLTLDPEPDAALASARTAAPGLEIKDWKDLYTPTLNGKSLPLEQYETSRSLAIAPDGEHFLLGTEWWLRLFDRQGQQLWEKPVPGAAWAVNVSGDGRLGVAAFGDGTIRWFRLADGEELLAFFPHLDRQRWVVWTPQGYYMASPGGEELIGWHVNHGLDTPEFYTASRFRDRFHRPDVVALMLEELDVAKALARANREAEIAPAPAPPLEEILPPVVQILDPTVGALIDKDPVAICWRVWAPGGEPITTLRIMINGTLAATFVDPNPADLVYLPVINRARSGRALISLIAESARGASDPASIGLQIAAAAAAKAPPPPTPRLFVLAVGVARYRQTPPEHLKYAARDAEDIGNFFLRQQGRLYREVSAQALMDDQATRATVTAAILGLSRQAQEDDVVMIFFSGHGIVERDAYYFLVHDANPQDQLSLRMTAIGEHDLIDCFRSLFDRKAKVYAFFDTCYAGALGGGMRGAPTDMERFASKLGSEEHGVVVFTSCTGQERSREDDEWQNGAFTEALLEALNGKAARPGEPDILLSDVERYLKARVPDLTGRAQTPKIYIPFKEFIDPPIAVVPE